MTDRQSRIDRWNDVEFVFFSREDSQCWRCKNRTQGGGWSCSAYPAGIPLTLVKNIADHKFPYAGDNGIRFEPMDPANEQDIIF